MGCIIVLSLFPFKLSYYYLNMLRIFAQIVTALLVIWTLCIAFSSLSGITIYFPFIISPDGVIPIHRQETVRTVQLPVNFLMTFLFYLVLGGLIIFQRRGVPIEEYYVAVFWTCCLLLLYFASRPLIRDYFR